MSQLKSTKTAFLIGGAILFNLIFWKEKMGLNTAFLDLLVIAGILISYSESSKRSVVRWLLAAHLICLAAVLYHNTVLSMFGFFLRLFFLQVFPSTIIVRHGTPALRWH